MKKFEDKLDILPTGDNGKTGIEEITLEEIPPVASVSPAEDLNSDYEFVRNKLLYAFERSKEVIDNAVRLVQTDPCPRAIESASTIFKTMNDNARELLNLHKNKNIILKELANTDTADGKLKSVGGISDILKENE